MEQTQDVGFLLKTITDRIRSMADRSFAAYGLTGTQVHYLGYLEENGGSASQRLLEEHFAVSHPTVIGIVSRLQEKGFVTVEIDRRDRRNRIVTMTRKAYDVGVHLGVGRKEMDRMLVRGFSDAEREQLSRFLYRILDNTEEEEKKGADCEKEEK
ncbi:MAG: MarR family winged helix-turn-helix transcriptional regulator [Lachnospiraceae bacterium]